MIYHSTKKMSQRVYYHCRVCLNKTEYITHKLHCIIVFMRMNLMIVTVNTKKINITHPDKTWRIFIVHQDGHAPEWTLLLVAK